MNKKLFLLCILITSIAITGCWDSIEIDDRTFIMALGIDVYKPTEEEKNIEDEKKYLPQHTRPPVSLTYVASKPISAGGEVEIANITMSSVSHSSFTAKRQMISRSDNELFLGHLKAVVLGDELVKNPMLFRETMDRIEKDPLISRRISMAVADGTAKEALEIETELEKNIGKFISSLFIRQERSNRAPVADAGDILTTLHKNGNVLIPRLVYSDKEIKIGGAAVIKDYKMEGWIGEMESLAYMIITNNLMTTALNHNMDDLIIPYTLTEIKTNIEAEKEGDNIKVVLSVIGEGDIDGLYFNPEEDVLDPSFVKKVQDGICKDIQKLIIEAIKVFQKDYQIDIFQFGDYFRKYKPDVWRDIEKDWEEIFTELEVVVETDIFMRRVGLSR
ncbi:Ger(x)C family spore germination protein [Alkaliphilus pronyensis]|uniref:Ger(X)C family spore germination protein n=1 Tax=Alkaliphilus pronyensis TaxID=1482732 RepID=A0A6I0FPK9_9FIRM|nr:Ger(x)C family spore germination protein [Alkaliphilus pronyensis]KAB3540957.1 Ger(x)C family spore germination protein [Alkaliphilus pronyensis]